GARSTTVSSCATTDAYAVGWSYSKGTGNKCGSAPVPTSNAQVFHFLKVTVQGSTVTVTPTDSTGRTFDVQTYNFGADTVAPPAPRGRPACRTPPRRPARRRLEYRPAGSRANTAPRSSSSTASWSTQNCERTSPTRQFVRPSVRTFDLGDMAEYVLRAAASICR